MLLFNSHAQRTFVRENTVREEIAYAYKAISERINPV